MTVTEIDPDEVSPERVDIIDIRDTDDFREGHIPHAANIPLGDLEDVVDDRDWGDEVVVACYVGQTSKQAARLIDAYADDATVASMAGGYESWDGPLERPESRSPSSADDD
ncbi:rhodanese-like domain-containing protein [Halorussus gelatinilyticus]|uniref:Rhodanese-like domain-containing protein n=1 Tax=Halorussus gelatinilyticus TaxID=2937524 RepID=A0A8U0II01_9EURY|nr:rhodanese-like domain-containing protein [Halorussus gelatinilyticus]UPV99891.1 rhodanese-like domain-containing protein [Halorussus gelatinilyticus]